MLFNLQFFVVSLVAGFRGTRGVSRRWSPWLRRLLPLLFLPILHVHAAVKPLDRIVAVVDDDIVMESELEERMVQVLGRLQMQKMPMPPESLLRKRVMDQLIIESIQLQKANTAGLRVSDNQLNDTMTRIAQSNNMTLDQFQTQIESEGVTYASAREQIRREMIISRYQQRRVDARVTVSDAEVDAYLKSAEGRTETAEEYELGHILIGVPENPSQEQIDAARAKAEDIYEKVKQGADFRQLAITQSDAQTALKGGDLGWRRANQLPTLFATVVPALKVGEISKPMQAASGFHLVMLHDKRGGNSQIIQQTHVRHLLIKPSEIRSEYEAQQLINKLYDRVVQGGEDFMGLAKSYSDDSASATNGGDMEWISPGDTVPDFERVMDATANGEVSKPFRSPFGWHILQVLERRQQDVGAQVQANQARQIIHRRKYDEELENWLREIREEAYVEIKDKDLAAAEKSS